MKNQILSLAFFLLTTTLMVVQGGNSKKNETINQTEISGFADVAHVDVSQESLKSIY